MTTRYRQLQPEERVTLAIHDAAGISKVLMAGHDRLGGGAGADVFVEQLNIGGEGLFEPAA